MGRVIIREHRDQAHDRSGKPTGLLKGPLVTDEMGLPIKTVDTTGGTAVDCLPLTSKTHFVALESVDNDVRYVVRPKKYRYTPLAATEDHTPIPATGVVFEAVYPGAIISFLQTSAQGTGGAPYPFQSSYVPVLAL